MVHRIRAWFHVDLLVFTAIVGILVPLARPVQGKVSRTGTWVVGGWMSDDALMLMLFPDGYYSHSPSPSVQAVQGAGWTLSRHSAVENAFVLRCGTERFVIRSGPGSGVMDVLNEDASAQLQLYQYLFLEGPTRDGVPHGSWRGSYAGPPNDPAPVLLEYRDGELIDWRINRRRNLVGLNEVRKVRGLPILTERDFADAKPKAKEAAP